MNDEDQVSIIRYYIPNAITVLALCAGVSAIKFAFEAQYEKAIFLILIAATLDGFDGRIARLLNVSSAFGEQMDSLADSINFGVAPAMLLYSYMLHEVKRLGWIVALIYCIACCLRLARFNATINTIRDDWQKNYFEGIPAPAGALLALVPLYLGALGMQHNYKINLIFCVYTVVVAILLVSKLPVWNGKNLFVAIRRDVMLLVMLLLTAYVSFMATYTWETLAFTSLVYILFLPFSCWLYYVHRKK